MKVLFAGPSLHRLASEEDLRLPSDITLFPPAIAGDIARLDKSIVSAIGLVDGCFEHVPSIRHREIIEAIEMGISVLGGASMGALRAAECCAFGMVGIGKVFRMFASNELVDDDAVAQLHAPAEFGYAPLSEALVDINATIGKMLDDLLLTQEEYWKLKASAQRLHFKQRTYRKIFQQSGLSDSVRGDALWRSLCQSRMSVKAHDTRLLISALHCI